MRKTNSKEVKNEVRAYLSEQVNAELEERGIETGKPFSAYFSIIEEEKHYQKYKSNFDMFKDWLQGLGGFGSDIFLGDSKEFLKNWLNQTEEEANKYTTEESERLMVLLCWREFEYLMGKES